MAMRQSFAPFVCVHGLVRHETGLACLRLGSGMHPTCMGQACMRQGRMAMRPVALSPPKCLLKPAVSSHALAQRWLRALLTRMSLLPRLPLLCLPLLTPRRRRYLWYQQGRTCRQASCCHLQLTFCCQLPLTCSPPQRRSLPTRSKKSIRSSTVE
jgi:hypothetical protein